MGSLLYKCRDAHGNFEPSRALHLDDPSSSPPFSSSFILLNFSVILLGFLCCMCIARSIRFVFASLISPDLYVVKDEAGDEYDGKAMGIYDLRDHRW